MSRIATLSPADFSPFEGDDFSVLLDDGTTLPLKLWKVELLSKAPEEGMRDPFRVVFRGPFDPVAPQQVMKLVHSELGELELFVVPIGQAQGCTNYECNFA